MLLQQCPVYLNHLLRSDSETESDDESTKANAKTKLKKDKRRYIFNYRNKNLDNNKEGAIVIYNAQSKKFGC